MLPPRLPVGSIEHLQHRLVRPPRNLHVHHHLPPLQVERREEHEKEEHEEQEQEQEEEAQEEEDEQEEGQEEQGKQEEEQEKVERRMRTVRSPERSWSSCPKLVIPAPSSVLSKRVSTACR